MVFDAVSNVSVQSMSLAAPDLVVPVVAFRAWRIVDGRLLSPYIPCRWDGAVMHAECYPANRTLQFGRGWLDAPHDPPHRDCQCGIYAYFGPGMQAYYGEFDWVEGIVTVWGRLEAHRGGLRAEHARVCALARRPEIEAIAGELGVDVVERTDLETAASRYGVPLPPSLVPEEPTMGARLARPHGRVRHP
jgi:hypothetical protein